MLGGGKLQAAVERHAELRLNRGVIGLMPDRRVRFISNQSRSWVKEYFGSRMQLGSRLPKALDRWVREQAALLARGDDAPPPQPPLIVERNAGRLIIWCTSASEQLLLILEEQPTTSQPKIPEHFGVTRREAEVLDWVAQGKTNAEIATILGIRPRTVAKHIERAYQKLGIETRTAATRFLLTGGE